MSAVLGAQGNQGCQKWGGEGRHLGSIGGIGNLDSQLSDPCGLSLDSTGNIIVADTGNKLIKIFTPDGRLVMKIGGQGSSSWPVYCIQCGEYFIVSDHNEHCIKVFNREGYFQYKFCKQNQNNSSKNEKCYYRCGKPNKEVTRNFKSKKKCDSATDKCHRIITEGS